MAVGLSGLPELHSVRGVRLGTTEAGITKTDRKDLVIIDCAEGTEVAGTFTQNRFCAPPVILAKEHLASSPARACIINTGYANAGTGVHGLEDAKRCCQAVADSLNYQMAQVLPFSTGVIGGRIPVDTILKGIDRCTANLSEDGWRDAAHGIMTTDTVAKGSSRKIIIDGIELTITGIVKGAGMIRPNMATMLAFVATDARLDRRAMETALQQVVESTFNRITVDGDTSTNDACMLFATGASGKDISIADSAVFETFVNELKAVFLELAQAIIRDAEGATKFITIQIDNGRSEQDCLDVAYTVAHSPLVKTAFFASDPNWGRILAAVGRADIETLDINTVSMYLDDVCIVRNGQVAADYQEASGQAVMDKTEITIGIDLCAGSEKATVWTSDLSHEYVRINAEYRS